MTGLASGVAIVLNAIVILLSCHRGDHVDLDQELRPRQSRNLHERRGGEVATVEATAHRSPVLTPDVDAQHPRGLLHHAGRGRPGGAEQMADVLVDLLGLTWPVIVAARDGSVDVVSHLTGEVDEPPAVDDHALVKVSWM